MALTGLHIQKLLPKTNCKECGSNTCLAFAMKLAAKKADISACPYASEEAVAKLGAAYAPPVKTLTLGNHSPLKTGGETVLYRHKKTFVNRTVIGVEVSDTLKEDELGALLNQINEYRYERVGELFTVDLIGVTGVKSNETEFADLVDHISKKTQKPLALRHTNRDALVAAAKITTGAQNILYAENSQMVESLVETVKETGHSLTLCSEEIDQLVALSQKMKEAGVENLLLDFGHLSLRDRLQINSLVRQTAIEDGFKPLGYPFMRYLTGNDMLEDTVDAVTEITKYGGVMVLPSFDPALISSLFTLRLNIYTDPQNPVQVEPKIYSVGEPDQSSPVFVTTNFSLTFFVVSGEIENCGVSAWLVVPECEGMSVLTAWAAGKFSAASIGKFIKETELEAKVNTREIIIPGLISQISGELEEELPGWKIKIGPREVTDLEGFVKEHSLN